MSNEINLDAIPLSWLSNESRNLLSCLLNTTKVISSDGPEKLPRDWRGLASLAQISSQVAVNIESYPDKTAKVLEIWINQLKDTAYVGSLRQALQRLDRYDVWDDCLELHKRGQLIDIPNQDKKQIALTVSEDYGIITYDDQRFGEPQTYHAFVLYAQEDKDFVDDLLRRMSEENLKLCTLDDLLPGHATQYAPVSRLISGRCQRIILICSPDFLRSPANAFYTDYAQAIGIEKQELKILPIMYRDCLLPSYLGYYHKLHFSPPGHKPSYDFWKRLRDALKADTKSSFVPNYSIIPELTPNGIENPREIANGCKMSSDKLQLPKIPTKSASLSGLDSCTLGQISLNDTKSQCSLSQLNKKPKKPNKIKVFLGSLTRKKKEDRKKAEEVEG